MFIIESYSLAIIFLFVTMICWGSWSNTQKLVSSSNWQASLFYWDYTIGLVLCALLLGLTLGSSGEEGRSFWVDLKQGSFVTYQSAFLGGVVFNLSNLLIVAAIDIAGIAVGISIGVGIALVQGVVLNYISDHSANPYLIFGGVALVVLGIILSYIANKRLPNQQNTSSKGVLIAILSGIVMGFFYRFVADSISFDFHHLEAGKFSPYSAVFIFSIGVFISNFLWNSYFMYKPIKGEKATYADYFKNGTIKLHSIGILGGLIWNIGMSFSLIASGTAGPTVSYGLGQGATMIAIAWGVFVWREFREAPKGTNLLIGMMFSSFLSGIVLIIFAKV